jgi:hypothetical protein
LIAILPRYRGTDLNFHTDISPKPQSREASPPAPILYSPTASQNHPSVTIAYHRHRRSLPSSPSEVDSWLARSRWHFDYLNVAGSHDVPDDFIELADIGLAFEVFADCADGNNLIFAGAEILPDLFGEVSVFQFLKHMLIKSSLHLFSAVLCNRNSPLPVLHLDNCGATVNSDNGCQPQSYVVSSDPELSIFDRRHPTDLLFICSASFFDPRSPTEPMEIP